MRRLLIGVVVVVALLIAGVFALSAGGGFSIAVGLPRFDPAPFAKLGEKYDVRILRDTWGVPHIYGKRDADTAFGLAYAHAEDDFATMQQSLMTSRGQLALVDAYLPRLLNGLTKSVGIGEIFDVKGTDPAITDYLVQLLKVREKLDAKYETDISAETRAVLDAYADGINLYAAQHPDKMVPGFTAVSGKDIAAGFVFFTPLFFGLDHNIAELFQEKRQRDVSLAAGGGGSNAFAVAPSRSADRATRLLINSHQPYTGPLAWYEARVHSEEGWDMAGGVFPGSPFILHGFGPHLGWANTVNTPDLTDVYVLTTDKEHPGQYKFDGEWRNFEYSAAYIRLRLFGSLTIGVARPILYSVYGPVIERPHGTYAIRFANIDKINQVEQYFRLNKAHNAAEWEAAMRLQAIPSQNYTYADETGRIAYYYNAVFPKRDPAYDWQQYLPGDTSRTLWTEYLPFDASPHYVNPPSGFLFNANNDPFFATAKADDLKREDFSKTFGIETRMTNRGLRAFEQLDADASITRDEFRTYKFDKTYSKDSMLAGVLKELLAKDFTGDELLSKAQAVLRSYDMTANMESRGAALAIMTALPVVVPTFQGKPPGDAVAALRKAAQTLMTHFGRLDPEWGEVNRLRRGKLDLPAAGGPDTLRAIESTIEPGTDGKFEANKGDTLIYFVEWDQSGKVHAESIHQFGSATLDANSPHYADQAPLYQRQEMKPVWLDEADVRQHLEREYRPGR